MLGERFPSNTLRTVNFWTAMFLYSIVCVGEWISGSMCMYVVDEMLEAYKNGNEQVREKKTITLDQLAM